MARNYRFILAILIFLGLIDPSRTLGVPAAGIRITAVRVEAVGYQSPNYVYRITWKGKNTNSKSRRAVKLSIYIAERTHLNRLAFRNVSTDISGAKNFQAKPSTKYLVTIYDRPNGKNRGSRILKSIGFTSASIPRVETNPTSAPSPGQTPTSAPTLSSTPQPTATISASPVPTQSQTIAPSPTVTPSPTITTMPTGTPTPAASITAEWHGACWMHLTLYGITGNFQGMDFKVITPLPAPLQGTLFFAPNCDPSNGTDNMNDFDTPTNSTHMIQGFSHFPDRIPSSAYYWFGPRTLNGTCAPDSPCSGCVNYSANTPTCDQIP